MYSDRDDLPSTGRVSPFRDLGINACLAAPPSLSQPCHVFHRFLAPKHPPYTLCSLAAIIPGQPVPTASDRNGKDKTLPKTDPRRQAADARNDTASRTRVSVWFKHHCQTVPNCQRATTDQYSRSPLSFGHHRPLPKAVEFSCARPALSAQESGGDDRARTDNLRRAKAALSQVELHPRWTLRPAGWNSVRPHACLAQQLHRSPLCPSGSPRFRQKKWWA